MMVVSEAGGSEIQDLCFESQLGSGIGSESCSQSFGVTLWDLSIEGWGDDFGNLRVKLEV